MGEDGRDGRFDALFAARAVLKRAAGMRLDLDQQIDAIRILVARLERDLRERPSS